MVTARMKAKKDVEEKMKWGYAAIGLGLVGYAVWQYVSESQKAAQAAQRKREPWERV